MLNFLKPAFSNAGQGVPLTFGEIAFVKSIFGEEVDASIVRKHFISKYRQDAMATAEGKTDINFYGCRHHSKDYSRSRDLLNYGCFIHEMTHIWQRQQSIWMLQNEPCNYKLSPQYSFADMGFEEQAYIIEDYARQFVYPHHKSKNRTHYRCCYDNSRQSLFLLQKIVEDRFPEARKTRIALKVPDAAPVPISKNKFWGHSTLPSL